MAVREQEGEPQENKKAGLSADRLSETARFGH